MQTHEGFEIATLPAGSVIEQKLPNGFVVRLPDGTVESYTVVPSETGEPMVIKTTVPPQEPVVVVGRDIED